MWIWLGSRFSVTSFGAWVAPIAANRAGVEVAFVILSVGGAVSVGQEQLYDELTGFSVCQERGIRVQIFSQQVKMPNPHSWRQEFLELVDSRVTALTAGRMTSSHASPDWSH